MGKSVGGIVGSADHASIIGGSERLAILSLGYNLEKLYLYICKGKPVRLFGERLKLAVQSANIANIAAPMPTWRNLGAGVKK